MSDAARSPDVKWTFKTLKFGLGLRPVAEWKTAEFQFVDISAAARSAAAYMLAHAAHGEMVVVSLEPSPEYKPIMDRLQEHAVMLDELKHQFADRNGGGQVHLWNIIHRIDPEWPNPWREELVDEEEPGNGDKSEG